MEALDKKTHLLHKYPASSRGVGYACVLTPLSKFAILRVDRGVLGRHWASIKGGFLFFIEEKSLYRSLYTLSHHFVFLV